MFFSAIVLNNLRKRKKKKEKFNDTNAENANLDLNGDLDMALRTTGTVIGVILIVKIVILLIMLIVLICAIVKATKICGNNTALHIVLIFFIPLYALIFLIAGKSICRESGSRSRSRSRRRSRSRSRNSRR